MVRKNKAHIYKIVDFPKAGKMYGEFKAQFPKQAANKVFSQLAKFIDLKNTANKNTIVFVIYDTLLDKYYKYIGTRVELHKKKMVNIGDKLFEVKYRNIIAKYDHVF